MASGSPAHSVIRAGDTSVEIDDRGSRIRSIRMAGVDLLAPEGSDSLTWGCYPMVPWAGRLGGASFHHEGRRIEVAATSPPHAIHGLGLNREWTRVDARTRRLDLAELWELGGVATTTVAVSPRSVALELSLTATSGSLPVVLGWHPCFVTEMAGRRARLDFRAESMWERGSDGLPTGRRVPVPPGPWDDCFAGVSADPELSWGQESRIRLRSPSDTWVVFDERDDIVCVEPQTAPPDAFHHRDPPLLERGATRSLRLEIRA